MSRNENMALTHWSQESQMSQSNGEKTVMGTEVEAHGTSVSVRFSCLRSTRLFAWSFALPNGVARYVSTGVWGTRLISVPEPSGSMLGRTLRDTRRQLLSDSASAPVQSLGVSTTN